MLMESKSALAPGGLMELSVEKLAGVSKKDEDNETAPFLILVFTVASESAKKPRKRATPAKKVKRESEMAWLAFFHLSIYL